MCDLCNYNAANINNAILTLCNNCYNHDPEKYNLITQTNALNKYMIKKSDLTNVRHIAQNNRYHKLTYLYLIKDIEHLAIQKHGSIEIMNEKINKKVKGVKDKFQMVLDNIEERKKKLSEYLIKIGFGEMRNDSVLCNNYIYAEKSEYDLVTIGNILLEMKFLHIHTNYAKELRKIRFKEIEIIKEIGHYAYWNDEDEENLRKRVKTNSIRQYVETNYKDMNKVMAELPTTIQPLAQKFYAEMIKQNKI